MRKLSKNQVAEVRRRLFAGESQRVIAKDFGVSRGVIAHIAAGRSYTECVEDNTQYEAEITHLKAELLTANKKLRERAKDAGLFAAVREELESYVQPIPALPKQVKTGGTIEEDLVMHVSDGHHDQIIRPEECGGFENHNFDISCRRAEKYVDTTLQWATESLGKNFRFKRLWWLAYGDHTSGEIHGAVERSAFRNQFKNCLAIGQLHAQMLTELAPHFEEVIAVYVPGNHGRRSVKKDYHGAQNNWDYLIAEIARMKTEGVQFIIPNSFSANLNINGVGFNVFHGDDVRTNLGIPWYGLARRQTNLQRLKTDIRYFCCGHFHRPGSMGDLDGEMLINGPWVATDSYAFNSFASYTEPAQWLHGVNPRHGITWRLKVNLRTKGEERGPERYRIAI